MQAPAKPRRCRQQPFERRRIAERELVDEISSAARSIFAARNAHGEPGTPVFRTDGVWRVLTAVASSPYCLCIADLARVLRVRKQTAHELAHAAAKAGLIELAPNHDDKRILQALLTPSQRLERDARERGSA